MGTQVVLRTYLDDLKKAQREKPIHERLPVPTIREFAQAAGVSTPSFMNYLNSRWATINIQITDAVFLLLRKCGHNPKITDFIDWVEDDNPQS